MCDLRKDAHRAHPIRFFVPASVDCLMRGFGKKLQDASCMHTPIPTRLVWRFFRNRLLRLGALGLAAGCSSRLDAPGAVETESETSIESALCSPDAYENFFGVNVAALDPVYLPDVRDLGARWVRIEYRSSDGRDPAYYRRIINQVHDQGVKVLLVVGYSMTTAKPSWRANDDEWNAYRARFSTDLAVVAGELGGIVDAWEVWNEPDHQLDVGYDPGVPPHQFGLLLRDSAVILDENAGGERIIGGMATKRFDYIATARAAAGGVLDYHGLGVHTYGPASWSMATVRAELDRVYNGWFQAAGLPLWVTEAGGVATPQAAAHAAEYVRTLYEHSWNAHRDRVKSIHYFSWHDSVGFAQERFGLVSLDNQRKPGFFAYADLTPAWQGGSCSGPGGPGDAVPPEGSAVCVQPSSDTCYSATLTARFRAQEPNFADCHVASGTCLQVGYEACGQETCGMLNCDKGNWTCGSATESCEGEAVGFPGCTQQPPSSIACDPPNTVDVNGVCTPSCGIAGGDTCGDTASDICNGYPVRDAYDCGVCCNRSAGKVPWHAVASDRNQELSACAAGEGGALQFEVGGGWANGDAACAALGYARCTSVVDWQCTVFDCSASAAPSRMVNCE